MKTETVHLSQIQVNGANPRIIKDDKFAKLINSILALPKMLELRPIVVDNTIGRRKYALPGIICHSLNDSGRNPGQA